MIWNEFRSAVKASLADPTRIVGDASLVCSYLVLATLAERSGDSALANSFHKKYRIGRLLLVGESAPVASTVKARLAERSSADAAHRAVAAYVRAILLGEDLKLYEGLKRSAAGQGVPTSTGVKAILSDNTGNVTAQAAVAEYVRGTLNGNRTLYDNLKFRALGQGTPSSSSVKSLLASTTSADAAARAVAEYVRVTLSGGEIKDYESMKRSAAGQGVPTSSGVKAILSDTAQNDTNFALACYYFTRSALITETLSTVQDPIGKDMSVKFESMKLRLLGYSYSGSNSTLQAAVKTMLTADGTRMGVETFIDDMVLKAKQLLVDFATQVNAAITAGIADYTGFDTQISAIITAGIADYSEYLARSTAAITAGIADYTDYATFVDGFITQGISDMAAVAEKVEAEIGEAAIELQHYVDFLTIGQETVYTPDDFSQAGSAGRARLPQGKITHIDYVASVPVLAAATDYEVDDYVSSNGNTYVVVGAGTTPSDIGEGLTSEDSSETETLGSAIFQYYGPGACCRRKAVPVSSRNAILCGKLPDDAPYYMVDSTVYSFFIYPIPTGDDKLVITWNGKKNDFDDDDEVTFTPSCVEVVKNYVLSRLDPEPEEKQVRFALYQQGRSRLYVEGREMAGHFIQ